MEISSELFKIAKLNERAKPIGIKADNPTINLQQPNSSPFLGTNTSKHKMSDTPPQRNPRKVVHSSAELQKILSPKHKGSATKAKQSLFGGSSPRASSSQNPMDNNEMLRSISSIKTEQMRKTIC